MEDITTIHNEIAKEGILSYFSSKGFSFSKRKFKIQEIGTSLIYVELAFKTERELERFRQFVSNYKELIPPWVVLPHSFQGAPRWNQGYEEDYCVGHWIPFWKSLNQHQKEVYQTKYDCPKVWQEWLLLRDKT
ncbi:hypothetical protein D1818_19230 [Aquimarina sp. BL5]|uniref:hypothetical protein n=1 Tax=Aquimarina sp. BL5 TaxID=1714860 RepID=UPI000E496CB4|nr:hypothetical protein [Aquimarina sp. BL5]AXT52852.1 hypothetical protein D1818_19230 [Aquimarina sp. BL5]RKN07524.1 hypothetical protein D7036_07515 [Aquimarina sp. BL5]